MLMVQRKNTNSVRYIQWKSNISFLILTIFSSIDSSMKVLAFLIERLLDSLFFWAKRKSFPNHLKYLHAFIWHAEHIRVFHSISPRIAKWGWQHFNGFQLPKTRYRAQPTLRYFPFTPALRSWVSFPTICRRGEVFRHLPDSSIKSWLLVELALHEETLVEKVHSKLKWSRETVGKAADNNVK